MTVGQITEKAHIGKYKLENLGDGIGTLPGQFSQFCTSKIFH